MRDGEINRFLTAIANEPELAPALALAVGERQGDAACQAVAEFCQDRGFDLDAADAQRMHQALTQVHDAGRDLMDAELTGVDGGVLPGTAMPTPSPGPLPGPTGIAGTIVAIGQAIDPSLNLFKGW